MKQISVLIATYNRSGPLGETLRAMENVCRNGIQAEWVVVDNNSTDNTRRVVEEFAGRLPLRYLFEPRPGKNCALNRAINESVLGDLVVFTDDDVTPGETWLREVVAGSARWPNHTVFGGRIIPQYPQGKPPPWAEHRAIQQLGFSLHNLGDKDCPYPKGLHPFGPNLWVRRAVFEQGFRYDESVGPRPTNRIMGSETSFLVTLDKAGYPAIYIPQSTVLHRIQENECKFDAIAKRAFRYGRGQVLWGGLPDKELLKRNTLLWRLKQYAGCAVASLHWIAAHFSLKAAERAILKVRAIARLASRLEALRQSTHADRRIELDASQRKTSNRGTNSSGSPVSNVDQGTAVPR